MKRNINHKKYSKIKKLLKSANRDDILIGIELLTKTAFDYEDYCRNFPNDHDPQDFETKYMGNCFWIDLKHTFIEVDGGVIYCPRKESQSVDNWRNVFPEDEIKL